MNEMKCPFCQQELKHEKTTGIYCCPTIFIDCPLGSGTGAFGTKELWQELIRTRKALDVALCSLQDIAESNGDFITGASTPLDEHEYADMMLKEIKRQMKINTTLEQKD